MSETFKEVQAGLLESLESLLREAREARDLRAEVGRLRQEVDRLSPVKVGRLRQEVNRLWRERAWAADKQTAELRAKVAELGVSLAAREADLAGWKTEAMALREEVKKWRGRREDIRRAAVAAQSSLQILVSELTI